MKDESITLTIRINKSLRNRYDELAEETGITRNKLISVAMQYALDNLREVKNYSKLYEFTIKNKEN